MTYAVKEIFYTLQGEGANAGRPAVFCRFAGCNLWSGREEDRANAACRFCDTDFVGTDGTHGGRFASAAALADAVRSQWPAVDADDGDATGPAAERHCRHDGRSRFVVLTGGEPLLQVDVPLIDALHDRGFAVAVESNGTLPPPSGIDWLCVSPKAGAPLVATQGDELKVVVPQPGLDLGALAELPFDHRFLQPMDGPAATANTRLAVDYCLSHPVWRLSLQTHKIIGIR